MTISGGVISGTLYFVKDYGKFSGLPAEQQGNYLALHVEYDDDTTVRFTLVGGDHGEVTMPRGDHLMVCRIKDKTTQSIKITAEKDGCRQNVQTYSLTGLTLNSDEP